MYKTDVSVVLSKLLSVSKNYLFLCSFAYKNRRKHIPVGIGRMIATVVYRICNAVSIPKKFLFSVARSEIGSLVNQRKFFI